MAGTKRKQKKKKRRDEPVDYVVEITDWNWEYSFGTNRMREPDDPFMEFRHLELKGRVLHPKAFKDSAAEVTLIPDTTLVEEKRQNMEPLAVGSLCSRDGKLDGVLSAPSDALVPILTVLTAKHARFITLHGERMYYRRCAVNSYRLAPNVDEDDFVDQ